MKSKTARLIAVTAGALLAMTVTTGSTQAQQSSAPSGAFKDAVTSWPKSAPDRVRHLPVPVRPHMCDEFMDEYTTPFKG